LSGCFDAGGGGDSLKPETVCGDYAIVEDILDVGLGGEAAQGGVVVLDDRLGFDDGDAKVLVAVTEVGSDRGNTGFGVAGNGGVAIEDEVVVRRDAHSVDLSHGKTGEEDGEDAGSVEEAAGDFACNRDPVSNRDAKSRRRKNQVGHGCTSLFALRYASARKEFS
jgi:hypothetical protein